VKKCRVNRLWARTLGMSCALSIILFGCARDQVLPAPPALTSISPNSGVQGQSVPVTLTGMNLITGATIGVSGAGITVSNTTVAGTQITATFNIAANAAAGAQNVTVTTSGGSSAPQPFTVNLAPSTTPALTSISPNSGVQGQSLSVTLTGTNFVAGATIALSGAGITVSNTTVVSATQIRATFTIATNATTSAQNVTVTTSGGTSGAQPFTVNSAPPTPSTLTSVSPNSGVQGQSLSVTLTGTNFVAGATITLSGAGITVSSTTVVSATQITATFTIAANAATGAQNVTVTSLGSVTSAVTFAVNPVGPPPTLTSISPNNGVQGQSVPVTLTGTNFVAGATIALSGAGITVSSTAVVSATQITATFTIAANAATGAQNVTVTTSGGTSGAQPFTVNLAPPTLTSISPNSGVQGQNVPVTLTGTNFVAGATIALSGAGITVSSTTVVSATQIMATFAIAANAATGAQNVTATTSGGTSGAQPFTVNVAPPTLTSISPNNGAQRQSVPVTLTGTNFVAGANIALSGTGITVSNRTVVSATQITATFAIAANAATGAQNVTVTTPGGTSGAQPFTVNLAPPTLNSISPNNGVQGQSVPVTLTGTNFVAGATIALSGAGITVSSTTVVSATQITATFAIAANAATGAQNVTVTTSGGTSGAQLFTVNLAPPTLTSISPNNGVQGQSVPVTLTGTHFVAGATIALSGAGITVSSTTVVSATQITATFALAANAATGAQNVTVTTSGGTSGAQPFTVNSAPPTLSLTNPVNGATVVPTNREITATFSKPMMALTTATFSVSDGGTSVAGTVNYDATNNTAIFKPMNPLAAGTTYTATIAATATDSAGNPLASNGMAPNPWTFTTGTTTDTTSPTVSAVYPAPNSVSVPLNQRITVTFSEAMDSSTLTATTFTLEQGATAVASSVTYAGTTATFTPASPLLANSAYNLTITSGAQDLAGNGVASGGLSPNPWTFTTISSSNNASTTVSTTSPAAGAPAAPVDATINAVFSQGMDPATITTGTFTVIGPRHDACKRSGLLRCHKQCRDLYPGKQSLAHGRLYRHHYKRSPGPARPAAGKCRPRAQSMDVYSRRDNAESGSGQPGIGLQLRNPSGFNRHQHWRYVH
jgi:hypothetical protein